MAHSSAAGRCRSAPCPSAARSGGPACSRRGCRPRSARCDWSGVPSSSIESEPRRRAMVPSSTTVTPLRGDALAHQAGEGRRLLAVEVAFEPVADRLVQHDAGPAGAEHHVHLAGRRRHRIEIDQRLAHRLVGRTPARTRSRGSARSPRGRHSRGCRTPGARRRRRRPRRSAAPAGARRGSFRRRRAGSRSTCQVAPKETETCATRGSFARA